MDNPRAEKVAVVAEVKDRLGGAEAVLLTEYRGLNVRDLADLRKALADAGGEYKIYKNTMVRFAAGELDLEIDEFLVGPTALAFTGTRADGSPGDPVTMAKALTEFGKGNENLVIKAGLLEGRLLSTDEITALSKIAPREELLSRLAGGMAAPMQQFASLLNALPQKFAFALSALIEDGGAPGAPESVPAEADPAEESTDAPAAEESVDDAAEESTDDAPEAVAEESTEDAPEAVAEESTDDAPEAVAEELTDDAPEAVAEESTDDAPEAVAEEAAGVEADESSAEDGEGDGEGDGDEG